MFLLPNQTSLFAGIKDPKLIALIDQLNFRQFPRGFPVFQKDDRGTEIYVILNGQVEIVGHNRSGDPLTIATLSPGDLFGEFSYFTSQPRSFAAITKTDCAILEIQKSWLSGIEERYPMMSERLERLFKTRVVENVLRSTKLFSSLSVEEIHLMADTLEAVKYSSGSEIMREGERGEEIYIIKKGLVSISKQAGARRQVLKELGPGEIIGEMAAITGENRMASVHAVKTTEMLILPGQRFKELLKKYPQLLEITEEIVRHRSQQNSLALESILSQVVGDQWEGTDDTYGLQTEHLAITYEIHGQRSKFDVQLLDVSHRKWSFMLLGSHEEIHNEQTVQICLKSAPESIASDLSMFGTLHAKIKLNSSTHGELFFEAQTSSTMLSILRCIAKHKLQGIVFPQYKVQDASISVWVDRAQESEIKGKLDSMSLTTANVYFDIPCPLEEILNIRFERLGNTLLQIQAIAIKGSNSMTHLQFEYHTASERKAIDNAISIIQKISSPNQLQDSSPSMEESTKSKTILVKRFESSKEFIRTYMSSIDAGFLKITTSEYITKNMPVQVQLFIPGYPGVKKAVLLGTIKSHAKGVALVSLKDVNSELQNRLRALFERLIEVQNQKSWELRREELLIQKRKSLFEDPVFCRTSLSTLAILNILVYLYIYIALAIPHRP
ncbi:MAG: cyclic nucleotide-binding domain-containing protein [Bdellovibrionales bacterium]|nr:cyclic nucleotide-binding domain-containing protein [Bdellovibrionales bacterium]